MPKRRRRSFTPQFKAQVVLEVLSGQKSQAEVARQHKLKPELIARGKDIALEGLETLFQTGDQRDQEQDRIAELERMRSGSGERSGVWLRGGRPTATVG